MSTLITHAAVRLYPGSRLADKWTAANLYNCVVYRCSRLASMLLVAFMDGGDSSELCADFASRYCFCLVKVNNAVSKLQELGLLVAPDDSSHVRTKRICAEWSKYGWVESADYHLATLNYPFADYAADGWKLDFDRMRQYTSEQPDTNRTKTCSSIRDRISAPPTHEVLESLNTPFVTAWLNDSDLEILDKSRCLNLFSAVFGKLRTRQLSDDPLLMAPAIGKTSPSGGSRHPTECYLFATEVHGLEKGIYHFNVENSSLDFIESFSGTKSELMELFSGQLRASFNIQGFIVMTSVFERSMYRYREPRSFRAIYMDVGHLCGTLDFVAKVLGLNCLVQHGTNDSSLASLLKVDPLLEGVIYGAAIGGSCENV